MSKLLDYDFLLNLCLQTVCAAFIAVAFAMLFAVPRKLLLYIAISGAQVRFVRTLLLNGFDVPIVVTTFIACAVMSIGFIFVAPRIEVPRQVFTVASIISLIPGMDAYNCLVSLATLIHLNESVNVNHELLSIFHHGMRAFAIMLSISLAIAIPPMFFYQNRFKKS